MGSFNFIESSFLLSLGITFVLIVLLVYHFKQRLSAMEQKCDTMFDIVQNLVNTVKQTIVENPQERTMSGCAMSECAMSGCAMFMPNRQEYADDEDEEEEEDDDEEEEDEEEEEEDEKEDEKKEEEEEKEEDEKKEEDDIKVINIADTDLQPVQVPAPNYKKMTVAELRIMVTTNGMVANATKMSKTEMLKLL